MNAENKVVQLEDRLDEFKKITKPFLGKIEEIAEGMRLNQIARGKMDKSIDLLKSSIEEVSKVSSIVDPSVLKTIIVRIEELSRGQELSMEAISDLTKDIDELNIKSLGIKDSVQVYCINEIIYDNELLNHPEIFNRLANIYGADKVLGLRDQMSPELLHEAIESGNLELLGSILSLD